METTTADRAGALASRLERAAVDLVAVLAPIDDHRWRFTPFADVWSISKDAEHVVEAASYHHWIVRLTIGEKVPSRKPVLERKRMTSDLSPIEIVELIRERTENGQRLIRGLSEDQLDLPTKPPRARDQRLAETIEQVLIGHYDGHRREIESKLAALA